MGPCGWAASCDSEEPPNPDADMCLSAVEVGVSVHTAGCACQSAENGDRTVFWGDRVSVWNVCTHLRLEQGFHSANTHCQLCAPQKRRGGAAGRAPGSVHICMACPLCVSLGTRSWHVFG